MINLLEKQVSFVTTGDAHEAEEQGVGVHRVVVAIVLVNILKKRRILLL